MDHWLVHPWTRRGTLLLSGMLTGLAVCFGKPLGWLAWVSIVPAWYVLFWMIPFLPERGGYRMLWRAGLWFFGAMELTVFHWFFYLYPMSFTGLSKPAALLVVFVAWLGLSALQAVGMALIFPLAGLIIRLWGEKKAFLHPLIVAALWTVAEWCQTLSWFGVPWGRLALSQAEYLPVVQTVSLWGCYGLAFLIVAVNGYFSLLWVRADGKRVCAIVAAGFFLGNLLVGSVAFAVTSNRQPFDTVEVAAIQGNFSSGTKWNASARETMQRYRTLTVQALEENPEVALVLWPETAVPFVLADFPRYEANMGDLAKELDVTLMTGTFVRDDYGKEYSSVVIFTEEGEKSDTVYHKRRPVPFGEYVPMESLIKTIIPPLASLNLFSNSLSAGKDATVYQTKRGVCGFLVCFDSIYDVLARDTVRAGAQVLVLPTNDSWFFDSAAVYMHNNQARLRAIETGRCVIRAANTGVSSLISPAGETIDFLGPSVRGYVSGTVGIYDNVTPYVLFGNLFVAVSAAFLAGMLGIGIYRYSKRRREEQEAF